MNYLYNLNKQVYDKANSETLNLGAFAANDSTFNFYVKIGAYRLISVPTGIIATVASLVEILFCSFKIVLTGYGYGFRLSYQVTGLENLKSSVKMTLRSITEIFHLAMARIRGYTTSVIFDQATLHHLQDGKKIQHAFETQKPDFEIEVEGKKFAFHRNLLVAAAPNYFNGLLNSGMKEAKNNSCTMPTLSVKGVLAFRRFLYGGFPTLEFDLCAELIPFSQMINFREFEQFCIVMLRPYMADRMEEILSLKIDNLEHLRKVCFKYLEEDGAHPEHLSILRKLGLEQDYAQFLSLPPNQKAIFSTNSNLPLFSVNKEKMPQDLIFITKNKEKVTTSRFLLTLRLKTLHSPLASKLPTDSKTLEEYTKQSVEDFLNFIYDKLPDLNFKAEEIQRWADLLCVAGEFLDEKDPIFLDLIGNFERKAELLFLNAKESNSCITDKTIELTQQVAHQLKLSSIINLCIQKRFDFILDSIANNIDQVSSISDLFNEEVFFLTELKVKRAFNQKTTDQLISVLIPSIAKKCPYIQKLTLRQSSDPYWSSKDVYNDGRSEEERLIKDSDLFKRCGKLKKVEIVAVDTFKNDTYVRRKHYSGEFL